MMLIALLLAMQPPPVDFMAGPNRALSFKEREIFDSAFYDKRVPRLSNVLEAEKVLTRFSCIGSVKRWFRTYSFGRNPKTFRLDTSLIAFEFIEKGHGGKPAGRRITTLLHAMRGFDDSQFIFANGVYSIRTHLATVTFCGANWPKQ